MQTGNVFSDNAEAEEAIGLLPVPVSLEERIVNRCRAHGHDCAFSAADFFDLAPQMDVESALVSLQLKKQIVRIFDAEYVFAIDDSFSLDSVAAALCRTNGYDAIPCGHYALQKAGIADVNQNAKGFRTAEYVTNAPSKEFTGKSVCVHFYHKDFPLQGMLSFNSEFLVQIFEALGKKNLTVKELRQIRKKFSLPVLQKINAEFKVSPDIQRWIKDALVSLIKLQR